jgi:hypothetical protein
MPNSILATIGRFWLEINAHAWRYCPETVQHRLNSAYAVLSKELRELIRQQSDADFGRGWREGHDVGRVTGWEQCHAEAQRELARKNDQIQALMATVESYRVRGADGYLAESADDPDDQPLERIGVSEPRPPVHQAWRGRKAPPTAAWKSGHGGVRKAPPHRSVELGRSGARTWHFTCS